ncbi:MAG: hypothetical protein ACJ8GN_23905 [Longimicrobiaceae bacterium]
MSTYSPTVAASEPGIRATRRLMCAAAFSMLAFIALSLAGPVGAPVAVTSASGLTLLVVELFWLAGAAMGASFAMLLAVARAVERGRGAGEEILIWSGLLIGVMAGFILVTLLPVEGVSPPALAVLGAFLASLAFRMVTGARTPALDGGGGSATADS